MTTILKRRSTFSSHASCGFRYVSTVVTKYVPKYFYVTTPYNSGPGSVVGIATGYRLDGPGIESRWGRDFPHLSKPALEPTQPSVKWVLGLSRGKERPGRDADSSSLSSAVVHARVEPNLYSPYEPNSLHRASVPVQGFISACTRVHFTFYVFTPYNGDTECFLRNITQFRICRTQIMLTGLLRAAL
jgi:hypothetical protein